jgi:hypothetical protein
MFYKVIDNEIVQRGLPTIYTHEDGSQTSGYDLLPDEVLEKEGWREVIDNIPEYDHTTHHLESKEIIKSDAVIIEYTVVENDPSSNVVPSQNEIENAEYKIRLTETLIEMGVLPNVE